MTPDDPEGDGSPQVPWERTALAYDDTLGQVLYFGASEVVGGAVFWAWNGQSWTRLPLAEPAPAARVDHAMVFDATRRRVVLFGGRCWGSPDCEGAGIFGAYTWELESEQRVGARPAHVLRVKTLAADDALLDVRSIAARWRAGGSGHLGGVEAQGAELHLWDAGYNVWIAGDSNDAHHTAPGWLELDVDDPRLLEEVFVGPERAATLAATPPPNGTGSARLATDYVELALRYRRAPVDCPVGWPVVDLDPLLNDGGVDYEGTTSGSQAVTSGSCGGGAGAVVHHLTMPAAGTLTASTVQGLTDTVLYVRTHCGRSRPDAELACNDDYGGWPGSQVQVAGLQQGQEVFVVVDGADVGGELWSGRYWLRVEVEPL